MDYIKAMKWCSWYGSAGNALPEEHVKALVKELKEAKKEVRRLKAERIALKKKVLMVQSELIHNHKLNGER